MFHGELVRSRCDDRVLAARYRHRYDTVRTSAYLECGMEAQDDTGSEVEGRSISLNQNTR